MENSPTKKRLFVVIHTVANSRLGFRHAFSQTELAQVNGADGVVLIPDYAKGRNIAVTYQEQLLYLGALKKEYPDFSIGANFLRSFDYIKEDIYSLGLNILQADGNRISRLGKEKLGTTELFCGVAFKYSKSVNNTGAELQAQCEKVASICDVPTTSGEATGVAADIQKIKEIRSYLPLGKRLAIASGVDEENVVSYLQAGVTDFIVATSLISHVGKLGYDILDPEKVLRLATTIHSY